uniref:Uncharacterized protein n=1 Tax=Ciona savignyi TaxID=51511 RepID=H2YGG7_CIOSA
MLAGRIGLLSRVMASTYPHKFVPSHWVKASQLKITPKKKVVSNGFNCASYNQEDGCKPKSRHPVDKDNKQKKSSDFRSCSSHHIQSSNHIGSFCKPWSDPNKSHSSYSVPRHHDVSDTSTSLIKQNQQLLPVFSNCNQYPFNGKRNYADQSRYCSLRTYPTNCRNLKFNRYYKYRDHAMTLPTHQRRQSSSDSGVHSHYPTPTPLPPSNSRMQERLKVQSDSAQSTYFFKDNNKGHSQHCSKTTICKNERLKRKWLYVASKHNYYKQKGFSAVSQQDCFSVMSYNILSQKLLDMNSYLYTECDPYVLPWEYRWKNLVKEMDSINADVICLQEVEDVHYDSYIKPWLEAQGYKFSYKKRTGNELSKPDGVLTACRFNKFKIIEAIPVEYFRKNDNLTKWHNVGLIMMVEMGGAIVCIGNTHLVYNPKVI